MRYKTFLLSISMALLILNASARADDSAVLPFLDDNAFLVVRVDDLATSFKVGEKWIITALESSKLNPASVNEIKKEMAEKFKSSREWTGKFADAGGKRLYLVLSLLDLPDSGPFIVVPLEKGADGKALAALFVDNRDHAEQIGDAVVFGGDKTRERLKKLGALKPRPDLEEAMKAAGDVPLRAALIPTATVRQALEGGMPKLPEPLGGGSIDVVSQGIRWAVLSVKAPPDASLSLIVQAKDAEAANALLKVVEKGAEFARANGAGAPFDVKALLDVLTPKVDGTRLTIALNGGQIDKLAVGVLAPALAKARDQAALSAAMSTIRQLLQGCMIYAIGHAGVWPDSLDQIAEDLGGKEMLARLTTGVKREGKTPHYVYHKPANPNQNPGGTVVIHESFDGAAPEKLAVGFADGHVEILDEVELKKHPEAGGK